MAKRRKSSKKNSKCPEPFNTLIDLAAGFTMHLIADKMEKKHNYHKRGVPNPYRAASHGFTMGKLNSTEDIIKLGGVMGALGSFDDDDYVPPKELRLYDVDEDWEFDDIGDNFSQPINNHYAWRLNCEDGSEYGIHPEDFETRQEYEDALQEAIDLSGIENLATDNESDLQFSGEISEIKASSCVHIYCRVSRLDNGINDYYLTSNEWLQVGSQVSFYDKCGIIRKGIVLSVEKHTDATAPIDPTTAKHIIDESIIS